MTELKIISYVYSVLYIHCTIVIKQKINWLPNSDNRFPVPLCKNAS